MRVFRVLIGQSLFFSTSYTPFCGRHTPTPGVYHNDIHKDKPFFAFFRLSGRFFGKRSTATHHQRKKPPQRRTDGQIRPLRRRARPLCARWLARLPVRSALRRSGRGAGEFVPRPSGSCTRRSCPRPAPRARRFRLRRTRCFCGSMVRPALMAKGGGWLSRPSAARPAPSPPASPPFRRPLAWSRRLWCAWWGAVAPAPAGRLCAVGLVGLAAGRALPCVLVTGWRVAFAPFRRGRGAPPAACLADGRSACRGVGQSWPFCFAGACPPSPAAPV